MATDWYIIFRRDYSWALGHPKLPSGNERQAAQLRQFDLDLTGAKTELGKQQQRAAKAEKKFLEERQNTAIRYITAQDQAKLSSDLSAFAGQKADIDVFPVSFEHRWVANTIMGILMNARWKIPAGMNLLSAPPLDNLMVQGIWISSTGDTKSQSAARALFEALKSTIAPGSI